MTLTLMEADQDKDDGVNPPVDEFEDVKEVQLNIQGPFRRLFWYLICVSAGKCSLSTVQVCVAGGSFRHRPAIDTICKGNTPREASHFRRFDSISWSLLIARDTDMLLPMTCRHPPQRR